MTPRTFRRKTSANLGSCCRQEAKTDTFQVIDYQGPKLKRFTVDNAD
jgi:hypothetical protein